MISVILPIKDEPLIAELVESIRSVLKRFVYEIIVVDAGKPPVNVKCVVISQKTKGLGNAILEGVAASHGEEVVVMDADFSHDPKDIPILLKKLGDGYSMIIGSRYCSGGRTDDSGYRYGVFSNSLISKFYCFCARLILNVSVKDPMSGFAAVRRDVYRSLSLHPRGYKIHLETMYKAKKNGFKIAEVPIIFHPRRAGISKTNIKEALQTFLFIIELRLGR